MVKDDEGRPAPDHGGTEALGGVRRRRPKTSTARKRVLRRTLLALGLAAVALLIVSGWQAASAHRHLQSASERLPQLREEMLSGNQAKLQESASAFRDDTRAARDAMDGANWWLFSKLPVVGPNVVAAQAVTEVVDDLATDAFPELVEANAIIDPANLRPVNRGIDLAPIRAARPHLLSADRSVAAADERLDGIDSAQLMGRVRGPVSDLSAKVRNLRSLTEVVVRAATLLPPMLGAQEPRTYLVLVQNNAEVRALGGLPGSLFLLRASKGRVAIDEQRPASSFDRFDEPLPLSSTERALFGSRFGHYLGRTTATPDFPRVAKLSRKMWRLGTGERVDGVISIDPVALQLLLGASGSVTLPGGRVLTAENAAQTLLNQVYLDIPTEAQDAFFARATSAIFRTFMVSVDPLAAGRALTEATSQGRVLLWSSRDAEQALISGTVAAGELRGNDGSSPVVGVYLNDRSSAKIAYYEGLDVQVNPVSCSADGSRQLDVSVTLSSNVPKNVEQLPDYLTGGGRRIPVGDIQSNLLVYAPTGGVITDVRSSGGEVSVTDHIHEGLQVAGHNVLLSPGESITLTYRIDSRAQLTGEVDVRTTPGPATDRFTTSVEACP